MAQYDPAVEAYIDNSADFAKPILLHVRKLIHKTCPTVEEAIKWGIPHFDYKGGIMCMLAAYKGHCSFTFHKAPNMRDKRLKESLQVKAIQRYMGKLTTLADLPADKELVAYIKEAMVINETGAKTTKPAKIKPASTAVTEAPDYFTKMLAADAKASKIFNEQSPSFRKNYIVWITDAKTDATRQKRIEQSLEWIAQGKGRFWQYEK